MVNIHFFVGWFRQHYLKMSNDDESGRWQQYYTFVFCLYHVGSCLKIVEECFYQYLIFRVKKGMAFRLPHFMAVFHNNMKFWYIQILFYRKTLPYFISIQTILVHLTTLTILPLNHWSKNTYKIHLITKTHDSTRRDEINCS